jgi:hypothetical protein
MLKADLYDLAEKIVAARALPVSAKQIAAAKTNKKTLHADVIRRFPSRLHTTRKSSKPEICTFTRTFMTAKQIRSLICEPKSNQTASIQNISATRNSKA